MAILNFFKTSEIFKRVSKFAPTVDKVRKDISKYTQQVFNRAKPIAEIIGNGVDVLYYELTTKMQEMMQENRLINAMKEVKDEVIGKNPKEKGMKEGGERE